MNSYHITAIDESGNQIQDIIFAENQQEMIHAVKSKSLYLVDYNEGSQANNKLIKLKLKSVVIYCRQLGTMISSGIPIIQSLDMIQEKADNASSRKVFSSLYQEVQKGNSLSKAMEMQKGAFPELLINMVLAGEVSGTLDNALTRMASHYDKELKLNNKVRTASIYPIILGVISVAVVLLLVTFVLPTITAMFPEDQMPGSTKIILAFSHFLINNWITIIATLIVIIVGIQFALHIQEVKKQYDKMLLRLPIIGKLLQTIYSARAARAMASLYSSGIQTLSMIETTAKVLNNSYLEELFYDVMDSISRGELISRSIEDTGEFDPMLHSMIFIGEESGSLGDILNSTADYFDDEADSAIARLVALLEPIMIVTLGVIIGFIVISIIQPIFQTYQNIT